MSNKFSNEIIDAIKRGNKKMIYDRTYEERALISLFANHFKKRLTEVYEEVDPAFLEPVGMDFNLNEGDLIPEAIGELRCLDLIKVGKVVNGKIKYGVIANPVFSLAIDGLGVLDIQNINEVVDRIINTPVIPCILDSITYIEPKSHIIDPYYTIPLYQWTAKAGGLAQGIAYGDLIKIAYVTKFPNRKDIGSPSAGFKMFIQRAQEDLEKDSGK